MPISKCAKCGKLACQLESVNVNSKVYHIKCIKCSVCNIALTESSYFVNDGVFYCKVHLPSSSAVTAAKVTTSQMELPPSLKPSETKMTKSLNTAQATPIPIHNLPHECIELIERGKKDGQTMLFYREEDNKTEKGASCLRAELHIPQEATIDEALTNSIKAELGEALGSENFTLLGIEKGSVIAHLVIKKPVAGCTKSSSGESPVPKEGDSSVEAGEKGNASKEADASKETSNNLGDEESFLKTMVEVLEKVRVTSFKCLSGKRVDSVTVFQLSQREKSGNNLVVPGPVTGGISNSNEKATGTSNKESPSKMTPKGNGGLSSRIKMFEAGPCSAQNKGETEHKTSGTAAVGKLRKLYLDAQTVSPSPADKGQTAATTQAKPVRTFVKTVSPKCIVCRKTAYQAESVNVSSNVCHKTCFKCSVCKKALATSSYLLSEGVLYCKVHVPTPTATVVADPMEVKQVIAAQKAATEKIRTPLDETKTSAPSEAAPAATTTATATTVSSATAVTPVQDMPMNVLAELRTAIPRNLVCPSCAGPLNVCGYGKCPGCSAMVCPCCEAVNDPVHEGLKCCVYSLVKEAFAWVKETFPEAKTVAFNENLKNPECLAMKRFLMTVGELERVKHFKPMFAWHGSSKEGISGIAKNGFDTTKRRGQSYGPGEYFGYTANVSKGYSTASKVLIATLIVTSVEGYGEYLKTVVGTCYVVNNPHDVPNDKTFCLPLCLAAYEDGVISF